ncbi:HIT family protein [Candidatus Woesearchaeota archaeon]|nr:HIT family protein [Candidatus Woesearchaeota archaeon]
MADDCVFCKILKKEVPCVKVYEDEYTFAFLDVQPINKGHTLVIPKSHHENLFDLPKDQLHQCISTVKTVALAIKESLRPDGINVGMNNNRAAGQVVFHAHFHIIPRFLGDGLHHWPGKKMEAAMMGMIGKDIAGAIKEKTA